VGDFATGFDGNVAWNKDNRGLTELSGERRNQVIMNVRLAMGTTLRDLYTSLAVVDADSIAAANATVLEGVSSATGRRERLYLDPGSGALVRRSIFTEGAYGSFSTDTYYENYRTVDGVRLPILISEFTPDFGTVQKRASVEHNATNAAALFVKPEK